MTALCHHLLARNKKVGDFPLLEVAGGDKEVAVRVRCNGDGAAAISRALIADVGTHAEKGTLGSRSCSLSFRKSR